MMLQKKNFLKGKEWPSQQNIASYLSKQEQKISIEFSNVAIVGDF